MAPSTAVEPPETPSDEAVLPSSGADAITLRDGSEVLIRPITAGDKGGLNAAFERLGEQWVGWR